MLLICYDRSKWECNALLFNSLRNFRSLLQKPNFDLSLNYFFVAMFFFSILGVFTLNFPYGRIFLGDGGAYFLGIAISTGIMEILSS